MRRPSAVLMGSKPGSVVALSIMLERGWDVPFVVVSRKHAHPWVAGPTLEEAATEAGIPVGVQSELPRTLRPDFVISYMYRYLVKPEVIGLAERAAVNFHAGPLPEFGGWAFYNVAILEDRDEYGCTCHYMDEGFDTGPLLRVRRFPIDVSQETAFSLERRSQEEMIRLFQEFCDLAESGTALPREPQDPARVRYMTQQEFERLKRIPPDADAATIDRIARAFWYPPYECAYMVQGGAKVEVVPSVAKTEIASLLHADDYARLQEVARSETRSRA